MSAAPEKSRAALARRWSLRLAGLGVLFACVTGPAPGNAGGCGAEIPVASARDHCINERFWRCRRDLAGGRIDMPTYESCLLPIQAECGGAEWPGACQPTPDQASECIELLSRADLAPVPTDALLAANPETCNLCP